MYEGNPLGGSKSKLSSEHGTSFLELADLPFGSLHLITTALLCHARTIPYPSNPSHIE